MSSNHFSFNPITRADFPLLVDWLGNEHVQRWWHQTPTLEFVEGEYGPMVDGRDPTMGFITILESDSIGFIQAYRINDYPEHAKSVVRHEGIGIDLFIGPSECIGQGIGPEMIRSFVDDVVRRIYVDARIVIADPEVRNSASVRAFEKAGFGRGDIVPGEHGSEQLMILDLDRPDSLNQESPVH